MPNDAGELVTVATYTSDDVAKKMAKLLVENGIGPVIDRGLPPEHESPEPYSDPVAHRDTNEYAASYQLRVVRLQVAQACALLGVEEPAGERAEREEVAKKNKGTPWRKILIIWGIAMILVPVIAFWATVWFLDR